MKKDEAAKIVNEYLAQYRCKSFHELIEKVGEQENFEGRTDDSKSYQIEVMFNYDDEEEKTVRVSVAISYSLWTDFVPVISDFIMSPDGTFIGE